MMNRELSRGWMRLFLIRGGTGEARVDAQEPGSSCEPRAIKRGGGLGKWRLSAPSSAEAAQGSHMFVNRKLARGFGGWRTDKRHAVRVRSLLWRRGGRCRLPAVEGVARVDRYD